MFDPPGGTRPAAQRTRSAHATQTTSLADGAADWLVDREPLVERLLRVPAGGVGLIIAPQGYGGSTLLRMLTDASPLLPIWVELPTVPSAGRQFLDLLSQSMAAQGIDVPLPGPAEAQGRARLGNALREAPDLLVLIDDLSTNGTPLDPGLLELLSGVPETMRVIVRTRQSPGVDVSRTLTAGRLVLIQRDELTLSAQQGMDYLSHAAPALDDDGRSAMVRLCEGWLGALVAGITADQEDPSEWLLGPGLDLLVAPLVGSLDQEDQDLLIRTSVIEHLRPDTCDAISGRVDGARRLRHLVGAQIVQPLPPEQGHGYRVHGLVREYLRRQLAERGAAVEREAALTAGRWLAARGQADEAISLLLEGGEVDEALGVLDRHVEELLDSGSAERVRSWYRSAPQLAVASSDLRLLASAWASLLTGDLETTEGHVVTLRDRALRAPGNSPDPRSRRGTAVGGAEWLRAETLLLRSFTEAWRGQPGRALGHVREVRASYGDRWDRMAHQYAALHEVALALWQEDHDAATRTLREIRSRPGTNRYYRQVVVPSLGGMILSWEGRAHRARFLTTRALHDLEQVGWLGAVDDCDARLARAWALVDLGDLPLALRDAEHVAQRASEVEHVTLMVLAAAGQACVRAAADEREGAEAALEHARQLVRERGAGPELGRRLDRLSVDLAVLRGDRRSASRRLARLGQQGGPPSLAIRVAAMGTSLSEAEVIQLVRSHQPTTPRQVVDARMLIASTLAPRRPAEAAMHLRTAADLAVEHGMLQALRGRSEELMALAQTLMADGFESPVRTLVAQLRTTPTEAPRLPALSPGELDLLERIRSEAVNRDLAAELGISVNTLKTRLRRLYAKLGVHDRAAALDVVDRPAARSADAARG